MAVHETESSVHFVDHVPDSLNCAVCLMPFRDPHLAAVGKSTALLVPRVKESWPTMISGLHISSAQLHNCFNSTSISLLWVSLSSVSVFLNSSLTAATSLTCRIPLSRQFSLHTLHKPLEVDVHWYAVNTHHVCVQPSVCEGGEHHTDLAALHHWPHPHSSLVVMIALG